MKYFFIPLIALTLVGCLERPKEDYYSVDKRTTVCIPVKVKDLQNRVTLVKETTYKCTFLRTTREDSSSYEQRKQIEQLIKEETNAKTL